MRTAQLRAGTGGRFVHLSGRTRHGHEERELRIPIDTIDGDSFIPVSILKALEDGFHLDVGLALRDRDGRPCELLALASRLTVPTVFRNDRGEEHGRGSRPCLPTERIEAFIARTQVLWPTQILLAGSLTAAVWKIRPGLVVKSDNQQAEALEWIDQLTRTTGGSSWPPGTTLSDVSVPLVGSALREPPYDDFVRCTLLDDRSHSLIDLNRHFERDAARRASPKASKARPAKEIAQ